MNDTPKEDMGAKLKCLISEHEARLAVLESSLLQHVKALQERMDLKFEAADKALVLQYTETQRRLHELNGHHAELKDQQAVSVTRDKFDDLVRGDIATLKSFKDTMLGRMALIGGASGVMAAAAMKWLLPG